MVELCGHGGRLLVVIRAPSTVVHKVCAVVTVVVLGANLTGCSFSDDAVAVAPSSPSTTIAAAETNPWTDSDLTAAVGAPAAIPGSLAGYPFETNGSQHVYFVDRVDRHIRQIWWDIDGWHLGDVTAATNAAEAKPVSLTGFVSETTNTQHLFYAGAGDGHVIQLRYDAEGWHDEDLTVSAGVPRSGPTMTGYSIESRQSHHVFYVRSSDHHVQELWWDSARWNTQDLSAAVMAPAGLEGGLVGYVDAAQDIQHVLYIGTDNHLYELWCDQTGWHMTDLTDVTGTPGPVPGTLAGFMFDAQGTQHVFFVGMDGNLYELWSRPGGWRRSDLTSLTGAPAPKANPIAAYAFEAQGTQHVIYTGVDNQLHELWWDGGGWHVGDLTASIGAPKSAPGRPLAYAFEQQGTQHIMYVTADVANVHELWSGNPEG